jgi:hypothetical protein
MRSRLTRWVVTLVAVVAGVVGVAAVPAQASQSQCLAGRICFWRDANFQGSFISYSQDPVYTCWNLPSSWNDIVTSVWNRTNLVVGLYSDANCITHYSYNYFIALRPNATQTNLTNNDVLTSYKFLPL